MTSLKRTNTKKGAPKISTRETKNNEDTPNKSGRNSQGKSQRRGAEQKKHCNKNKGQLFRRRDSKSRRVTYRQKMSEE